MRSQVKKQGKLRQIFSAPIKILSKAQKFYMEGMDSCSRRVGYRAAVGCPSAPIALPKSFSVNSFKEYCEDEESIQILCSASTRNMIMESKKLNSNYMSNQKGVKQRALKPSGTARSYGVSVGKIGRIDEEKPCSFEEDDLKANLLYPRSRSHVVRSNFV